MICRRDLGLVIVAIGLAASLPLAPLAQDRAQVGKSLDTAAQAIARGDGIAAEMAVRGALKAGASRADVAALAGEAELVQGDLAAARSWLEPRNFSPATRGQGFHAVGRLYLTTDDLTAAADAFDQAIRSGAATAGLWVDIARLRYRSGQQHQALPAVDRALEIDPDDAAALHFRAQLARDALGMVAALPWLQQALKTSPENMDLLGEYAAILGDVGRHADMLKVARRMVEIDPRHPRAYFLQAMLAARAGHHDIARRLMWRTDGIYDEQPGGLMLNGILELESGNTALAVQRFDLLARMQPDNRRARLLLGRALLANGEANEVVARLGPVADKRDAEPYLLALVGRAHEQLGDRARAARYLDRAAGTARTSIGVLSVDEAGELAIWRFRDDPTNSQVAVPLLRQMIGSGRNAEARALATALLARFPGSSDMERLAGDVMLLTGSPDQALTAYARSGQVRTDIALLRRTVAAELALGQGARARQRLEEFVTRNPRSADGLQALAAMAAQGNDWKNTARLLARASQVTSASDPRLLARLSQAQARAGMAGEARASALLAYRLQRSNRMVAQALAAVTTGSRAQALRAKAGAATLQ